MMYYSVEFYYRVMEEAKPRLEEWRYPKHEVAEWPSDLGQPHRNSNSDEYPQSL